MADAERPVLVVRHEARVQGDHDDSQLVARAIPRRTLVITYELDYGARGPLRPQLLTFEFSPELFVTNLAFARTFILEAEVAHLQAQGYGRHLSPRELLVIGASGPIDNAFRTSDECVRHKVLDCLGDLALLGCDLHGHFRAFRTGHAANHAICRGVRALHDNYLLQPRAA
jgi:UDP-3-O-acyl-N-acetylglucosamine deacetylase